MPKELIFFQKISDLQNMKHFKKFTKILIPDFEDENKSLAWKLSHPSRINEINYEYIWILSDFDATYEVDEEEKIDYLFTITWYLQEYRKSFIDTLIKQSRKLRWKKM